MRELDQLLERWLDRRWSEASAEERRSFERLLACEDDRLWDWITGRSRPQDRALAFIVDQVVETGDR